MSIFNPTYMNIQRSHIETDANRVVKMWNFYIDFRKYFSFDENVGDMNEIFMYNVKSVELPKYSMKIYRKFHCGAEKSYPVKRVCDGNFTVTFYGRYHILNTLIRMSQNYMYDGNLDDELQKKLQGLELYNIEETSYRRLNKLGSIDIIQMSDNLDGNSGKICYSYMKPVLISVDYNELNSMNNGILEISCVFSYDDFRVTTDTFCVPYGVAMNGQIDYDSGFVEAGTLKIDDDKKIKEAKERAKKQLSK